MRHADPYAVMRNNETLQAYRAWRRASWRAGQPFLAIALVAYSLTIGLFVWGLLADPSHRLLRALPLLLAGGGVAFVIGAIRVSLYQWANPPPGSAPPRA